MRSRVESLPIGRAFCLAEGEGRNAVFLAEQGIRFDVTAVDQSSVGLAKARRLAAQRGIAIETLVADLADFSIDGESWDTIVSIFAHVPTKLRQHIHHEVVTGLRPGGLFLLEAYRPQQLEHGTGGPSTHEMMMELGGLRAELGGLEFEYGAEIEREVHEGTFHKGLSAVVQVLARNRRLRATPPPAITPLADDFADGLVSMRTTTPGRKPKLVKGTRPGGRPDYGIDAPGVVAGFFVGSAALATARTLFRRKAGSGIVAACTFAAAVVPGLLGVSMLLYSRFGKQRLRDHLLGQRLWRGDETVLDIGAGRGLMAIGAAKRVSRGEVIALDIWSAKDLTGNTPEALRENAAIENVCHVLRIVTGDAQRLDLADESIDVVVSVFCLHNLPQPNQRKSACREIARVLKPGGSALIADFPSTRRYVPTLRQAGLVVEGPRRAEHHALGIAGYLIAHKPTVGAVRR